MAQVPSSGSSSPLVALTSSWSGAEHREGSHRGIDGTGAQVQLSEHEDKPLDGSIKEEQEGNEPPPPFP